MVEFKDKEPRLMVIFTAEVVEENIRIDTNEILDVQWLDIEKVKNMPKEELRGYDEAMQFIKYYEENKIYPLDLFNNTRYVR